MSKPLTPLHQPVAATLPIFRSRQILIISVHINYCLINIDNASSQSCCHVRELLSSLLLYSRLESQVVGNFAQQKAEAVASPQLPKFFNVFRDPQPCLLMVYEYHYTPTMIRRPETSVFSERSRLSLNRCLFQ
jgi:hypothetical protein